MPGFHIGYSQYRFIRIIIDLGIMTSDIIKSIKTALLFIGVTILVVVVISVLVAWKSGWDFMETFGFCLIFGGAMVMYSGAMMSAGGAEKAALTAAAMTGGHHANFYQQYGQERQSRRDSQFYYMLLMFVAGLILLTVGFWILG